MNLHYGFSLSLNIEFQSDDPVYSNVEFSQAPSKIDLDSAAMFHMAANLEFRSDNFKMEISIPSFEYEPDNLVSLGKISVEKFGKNYLAIPTIASHYRSFREKSVSELSFSKSILDMGIITNIGEKSRSFSNSAENVLHFVFPIYVLNFKENISKNVSFVIRMYLGNKTIWSKWMNITIEERKHERSSAKMLSSIGKFTNYNVSKGGLTQLIIKSNFSETDGFADYSLMVEVPVSNRAALFIPCAAKFINGHSGFNIPYLSEIAIKPVQEDSNQFVFTFDRIHFVAQRNGSSGDDNLVVAEITFRVPFHHEIDDGVYVCVCVFNYYCHSCYIIINIIFNYYYIIIII